MIKSIRNIFFFFLLPTYVIAAPLTNSESYATHFITKHKHHFKRHTKHIKATATATNARSATMTAAPANDLPTHPPIPQHMFNGLTVSGYAAGSYNYLSRKNTFISGSSDREFDTNTNGFTLQQAAISIAKQSTDGFGYLFNPLLGSDANVTAAYGMAPLIDSQNFALDLVQAYVNYTYNKINFMAGKFSGLAGYEYTFTPLNSNFSSSYLAEFLQPISVTGVRAIYSATDKLSLTIGVNDGWDNVRDWNRRKTVEASITFTDPKYTLNADLLNGEERYTPRVSSGPKGTRTLLDVTASLNATDKLTLGMNYDYATQSTALLASGELAKATWQGIAGYGQYQINDKWRTAVRGGFLHDPDGFATGVPQNLAEATVTLGYLVFNHFELRGEARNDFAKVKSFKNNNGFGTSSNMQSLAVEGILAF